MKSFTHFGSSEVEKEQVELVDADYNDPSLVGLNFYQQYGQHDDRPLRLSTTSAPAKVTCPLLGTINIMITSHAKVKSHL